MIGAILLLLALTAGAADAPRVADEPASHADAPVPAPDHPVEVSPPSVVPPLQRSSPHHPPVPYDASDPSCAACHVSVPPRGAPPSEARLRTDPALACGTCHPNTVHRGIVEHLGQTVPAAIRASLPPSITLGEDGAVHCWSCHDVHAGVGAGELRQTRLARAVVALGPSEATWPGAPRARPALLALPLEGGALCRACHGAGP